jgi:hypothetical protein
MVTLSGRPAMRSPGAPPTRRDVVREFWGRIAEGLSTADASAACGVSEAVGCRLFRQGGGMPNVALEPPSGRYLPFAEREEIALARERGEGCARHRRDAGALAVDDLAGIGSKRGHPHRPDGLPGLGGAVES